MTDARFEDATPRALNLGAADVDDLTVLSSLAQDAVFPVTEMKYIASENRFAVLLNRFRWEDKTANPPVRVQSVLSFDGVQHVASSGIDRRDTELVLSLLNVAFDPSEEGSGHITLTLAGDGALRLSVECIDARLRDVTQPYAAPSGQRPQHPA